MFFTRPNKGKNGKLKRRRSLGDGLEISNPINYEHPIHMTFNAEQKTFYGVPSQWLGILDVKVGSREDTPGPHFSTQQELSNAPSNAPVNVPRTESLQTTTPPSQVIAMSSNQLSSPTQSTIYIQSSSQLAATTPKGPSPGTTAELIRRLGGGVYAQRQNDSNPPTGQPHIETNDNEETQRLMAAFSAIRKSALSARGRCDIRTNSHQEIRSSDSRIPLKTRSLQRELTIDREVNEHPPNSTVPNTMPPDIVPSQLSLQNGSPAENHFTKTVQTYSMKKNHEQPSPAPLHRPQRQLEQSRTTSTRTNGTNSGPSAVSAKTTEMPQRNGTTSSHSRASSRRTKERQGAVSKEEIRKALEMVVRPGDPRMVYETINQLGVGSTSTVWRARERSLQACLSLSWNEAQERADSNGNNKSKAQRLVAIKKMDIFNQQRRELLFNEVIINRDFKHPNLVESFGTYLVENELWVIMEHMEGGTLTNIILNCCLTENQIATVCVSVLKALEYLHSNHIIHRDIKSDSVLLAADGTVKLSDLGFCAKLSAKVPKRYSLVGTPYWLAPEICARQPYDTAVDIWSLGILLVEMVDGEPPFFDKPAKVVMSMIAQNVPPPMFKNPQQLSVGLLNLFNQMVRFHVEERPTATQLLQHHFLQTSCRDFSCLLHFVPRLQRLKPIGSNHTSSATAKQ